jgi:chemotaxis protein MotB
MRSVCCYLTILSSFLISCVSTSQFKAVQKESDKYDSLYTWSMRTLKTCQDDYATLGKQKSQLQDQTNGINLELTASKENNTLLRKQLHDLGTISSAQAESIKKSLDNMGAKDSYIQDLRAALAHRDSVNLVVLMGLKAALGSFGEDVIIKIEKGTVTADLSDKLLFTGDSSNYAVTDKARSALGRIARVLNDLPDIEFMIEGHTDSIPYARGSLLDNWDLSVKRATTLARILQSSYNIAPVRIIAAGRSEYLPVTPNDTPEGRSANRRTRIIILPQLDRVLRLLERGQG